MAALNLLYVTWGRKSVCNTYKCKGCFLLIPAEAGTFSEVQSEPGASWPHAGLLQGVLLGLYIEPRHFKHKAARECSKCISPPQAQLILEHFIEAAGFKGKDIEPPRLHWDTGSAKLRQREEGAGGKHTEWEDLSPNPKLGSELCARRGFLIPTGICFNPSQECCVSGSL